MFAFDRKFNIILMKVHLLHGIFGVCIDDDVVVVIFVLFQIKSIAAHIFASRKMHEENLKWMSIGSNCALGNKKKWM